MPSAGAASAVESAGAAPAKLQAPQATPLPLLQSAGPELRMGGRPGMLLVVMGLHLLLALACFLWVPVHSKPKPVRPVQLSIVSAPAPPPPAPPKPLLAPALAPLPVSLFTPKVPVVMVVPESMPVAQESRFAAPGPSRDESARATPSLAAPATSVHAEAAAPTGPKQIPASAVRYLREPSLTVPLQSRRLGESGVVHLRIVVDAQGQLKDVSLKKSSGFSRLDQQALQDIRSARFAPYLENGRALEWETTALLSYESEK